MKRWVVMRAPTRTTILRRARATCRISEERHGMGIGMRAAGCPDAIRSGSAPPCPQGARDP
jgi:hypothetical protein